VKPKLVIFENDPTSQKRMLNHYKAAWDTIALSGQNEKNWLDSCADADLAIVDLYYGDDTKTAPAGFNIVLGLKNLYPSLPVIIWTGKHLSAELAVRLANCGADKVVFKSKILSFETELLERLECLDAAIQDLMGKTRRSPFVVGLAGFEEREVAEVRKYFKDDFELVDATSTLGSEVEMLESGMDSIDILAIRLGNRVDYKTLVRALELLSDQQLKRPLPYVVIVVEKGYSPSDEEVMQLIETWISQKIVSRWVDPKETDAVDSLKSILRSEWRRFQREKQDLRNILIYSENSPMRKVVEEIKMVAPWDTPVLIEGGPGTGKELIARAIHQMSFRRDKAFVPLNIAAVPEDLLESELFGSTLGAFTGAVEKEGLLLNAHMGTLLLDEIGECKEDVQVKLLRVLETRKYRRLGESSGRRKGKVDERESNFRLITATNVPFDKLLRPHGKLRPDFYSRIAGYIIRVPLLSERKEDIGPIAWSFLAKMRPRKRLSAAALDHLLSYDWPGNVRELRQTMERAAILSGSSPTVGKEHIQFEFPEQWTDVSGGERLDDVVRRHIAMVLTRCNWNKSMASRVLGIDRNTLDNKIKKYGLSKPEELGS